MWLKLTGRLGVSYRTMKDLNLIIDNLPGRRPLFQCQDVLIGNEKLQFHFRDILLCICAIYGDPEFVQDLVFTPERHYADQERMQWCYGLALSIWVALITQKAVMFMQTLPYDS